MFLAKQRLLIVSIVGLLSVTFTSVAVAQVGRSYYSNDPGLVEGMAVGLSLQSSGDNQIVEPLSISNKERFVGIVAAKESNVVTSVNTEDNVFVTSEGNASLLVSDLNGVVRKGDRLSASPLKGVAMRAEEGESYTIGLALEDFDETSAKSQSVEESSGRTRSTLVDAISTEINTNSGQKDSPQAFLSLFGESITGKPVSQLQVLAALILLFIILTIEGSIIYGAAHSTIQAVGRNPLAREGIYKQLFQVIAVAVLILLFGSLGIYLILWA